MIEALRAQARIELAQNVVAVLGAVASDDVALRFVLVGFAGLGVLHPLRSRRPHPHLAVMQHLRIARTHLRREIHMSSGKLVFTSMYL